MTAALQLPCDKPALFESVCCSRCGGCGHYSYNSMTGTRCFKCGGRGRTMTKRGAAAQAYFRQLLSKRADELQPGDKIFDDGCPGLAASGWREVESTEPHQYSYKRGDETIAYPAIDIKARGFSFGNAPADQMFRVAASAERKAEARAEALAYQETLTKSGQPRKTR